MQIIHFIGSLISNPVTSLPFSFTVGLLLIYGRKFNTSKNPRMSSVGMVIASFIITLFLTYRGFLLDNKSFYEVVFTQDSEGRLHHTMASFFLGCGFVLAEITHLLQKKALKKGLPTLDV